VVSHKEVTDALASTHLYSQEAKHTFYQTGDHIVTMDTTTNSSSRLRVIAKKPKQN